MKRNYVITRMITTFAAEGRIIILMLLLACTIWCVEDSDFKEPFSEAPFGLASKNWLWEYRGPPNRSQPPRQIRGLATS